MRYLAIINGTASLENGTVEVFDVMLFVEIFLIFISYIVDGTSIYIITSNYHPNLVLLLKHLYFQYFVQMFARLIQIYKTISLTDEHLRTDFVFRMASFTRNFLVFIAVYFAIFFMVERLMATYHMNDYERKQRLYIGYIVVIVMHTWCFISAAIFIFDIISLWYHSCSLVLFNFIAFLACVYLGIYNDRAYNKIFETVDDSPYSLSQRYQIVENIKTVILFKKLILCIILFSILCSLLISGDIMTDDENVKNWMSIAFNYSCISYGLSVPYFIHLQDPQKLDDCLKSLRKFFGKNSIESSNDMAVRPIRDRFGRDLIKSKEEERNIYFSNITRDWTTVHPRASQII
ncbi:unnamed protein product [Auanema sp. JU1783]|nr:unnamed protein product [Auanema sp. JU1783]